MRSCFASMAKDRRGSAESGPEQVEPLGELAIPAHDTRRSSILILEWRSPTVPGDERSDIRIGARPQRRELALLSNRRRLISVQPERIRQLVRPPRPHRAGDPI